DGTGAVVHFWDRECSIQRRHQKVIEIAPSPTLPGGAKNVTRNRIIDAAVKMAKHITYKSLGTFEFLLLPDTEEFFFMEANPRIQVEHTVTEAVTFCDLVAIQLQIAAGASLRQLGLDKPVPFPSTTSIQVRLNAEQFMADGTVVATSGSLSSFDLPTGFGVRVDTSAHAPRELARASLRHVVIRGVETNTCFVRAILDLGEVLQNKVHTQFVEERFSEIYELAASYRSQSEKEHIEQQRHEAHQAASPEITGQSIPDAESLRAPLPGLLVKVLVKEGQSVRAGHEVALLESMKMEHVVHSPADGVVKLIVSKDGSVLSEGDVILYLSSGDGILSQTGMEKATEHDDDGAVRPDLQSLLERRSLQADKARPEAVRRRRAAGFLTARENLALLVDKGSFMEWGDLAVAARQAVVDEDELIKRTSNDGVITGWGTINAAIFDSGAEMAFPSPARCALCIYDYMVLAGTQGFFHHRKLDRLFRSILANPAPLVLYAEGGGGRPGEHDLAAISISG
ncbi:hypothetical protein HK405_015172, partial [Cladochytrium tenue]